MNSFYLHIFAMFCMLLDHAWGMGLLENDIFTCIGRLAFPIFAFMIVEGYFKTSNLKRYAGRLFIFAIISEIPYNLMMGDSIFNPYSQNVFWTLLIGLGLVYLIERVKNRRLYVRIPVIGLCLFLGFFLGLIGMIDYNFAGIYMILVFYFFRGHKWYHFVGQLICLWSINVELLAGLDYVIPIGEYTFYLTRQGLALLSLIPIWLYNGKQGYYNKYIKYFYYSFYPLHILILYGIKLLYSFF